MSQNLSSAAVVIGALRVNTLVFYNVIKLKAILPQHKSCPYMVKPGLQIFFHDWWAGVIHGAKNDGSFSKHIKLTTVDIRVVYFTYSLTQTLVCIYVY